MNHPTASCEVSIGKNLSEASFGELDPIEIKVSMSNGKLLKDGAIPLYYQLETILRSRLTEGEFAPGDGFPSEAAIGRQYKVSRITVRQALTALERDGLLHRQPGRGTFVTDTVQRLWTPKLTGSLEDAIMFGLADKYEARLIDRSEVKASAKITEALGLETDEAVHRIQRIRLYDGQPLAHIVNYLPIEIGARIDTEDVLARPILTNLETRVGLKLAEANQSIGATLADSEIASLLDIKSGDPLVQMERTAYDWTGRAVNFVLVLFRADRYWYQVKLKRTGKSNKIDWSVA